MKLPAAQKAWNKLGETTPLQSMLAVPVSRRITKVEEYFAFGKAHTDELLTYIESLGMSPKRRKAVDFGCGLGRSTQALADYFEEVYGMDIAPSILELAASYNRHPLRCQYVLNETNDLSRFEDESVDFICCFGVLQAVSPDMSQDYIREFIRILVPGGVLVFQLPSEPARTLKGFVFRVAPTSLLNLYRRAKYGMEVYAMRESDVRKVIDSAGGILLKVREDSTHRVGESWLSLEYFVSK